MADMIGLAAVDYLWTAIAGVVVVMQIWQLLRFNRWRWTIADWIDHVLCIALYITFFVRPLIR